MLTRLSIARREKRQKETSQEKDVVRSSSGDHLHHRHDFQGARETGRHESQMFLDGE